MSDAFISDITQHQMFIIEKQKAFKSVGHHFPVSDNDSHDIKICWLLPVPGFNTGLCQLGFPEDRVSGLGVERERGEKESERGPQVSQLQAQLNPKVNGLEESQS